MIKGIGVDIVAKDRMAIIFKRYPIQLPSKILTAQELEIFLTRKTKQQQIDYLAKRFAAKEAVSKALGSGIGEFIAFKDISILNDEMGKPYVLLMNTRFVMSKNLQINISLSDEKDHAIAFVVISNFLEK